MTRKHFQDIADTLKRNDAPAELCFEFARLCKSYNSRFQQNKFLVACGLQYAPDGTWDRG